MKKLLLILILSISFSCQKEEAPKDPTEFEECKTFEGEIPQMTDAMAHPETGLIQGDIIPDLKQGKAALIDKRFPLINGKKIIPFHIKLWSKDENNKVDMGFRGEQIDSVRYNAVKSIKALGFEPVEYKDLDKMINDLDSGIIYEPGFGYSSSHLGYQGRSQKIYISIGDWHLIPHENYHAIAGGIHEHSRADRDEYIIVNHNNIRESWLPQFYLNEDAISIGKFDFDSVTMYKSYMDGEEGVAIDPSKPIMTKLDGSTWEQNYWYSECDLNAVNALYAED